MPRHACMLAVTAELLRSVATKQKKKKLLFVILYIVYTPLTGCRDACNSLQFTHWSHISSVGRRKHDKKSEHSVFSCGRPCILHVHRDHGSRCIPIKNTRNSNRIVFLVRLSDQTEIHSSSDKSRAMLFGNAICCCCLGSVVNVTYHTIVHKQLLYSCKQCLHSRSETTDLMSQC